MSIGEAPLLDIEGMTFIASSGETNEIVLESDSARFDTQKQLAFLEVVRAEVAPGDDREGFERATKQAAPAYWIALQIPRSIGFEVDHSSTHWVLSRARTCLPK